MSLLTDFLTLAITETQPQTGQFNVIAMEMRSQNIVPIHLDKEQIVSSTGEIFWDIGFVTSVNGSIQRKYLGNDNSPFVINGSTKFGANRINTLKAIFDAKSTTPQTFFDNDKQRFCILKINKVENLAIYFDKKSETENIKNYLSVYVGGMPAYQNPISLLNKDYRWINFWIWVCKNDAFEEKKKKYLKLLNRKDKELYLILYRHHFKTGSQHWIVGMHWL